MRASNAEWFIGQTIYCLEDAIPYLNPLEFLKGWENIILQDARERAELKSQDKTVQERNTEWNQRHKERRNALSEAPATKKPRRSKRKPKARIATTGSHQVRSEALKREPEEIPEQPEPKRACRAPRPRVNYQAIVEDTFPKCYNSICQLNTLNKSECTFSTNGAIICKRTQKNIKTCDGKCYCGAEIKIFKISRVMQDPKSPNEFICGATFNTPFKCRNLIRSEDEKEKRALAEQLENSGKGVNVID